MITHIVIFKWKKGVPKRKIRREMAALLKLKPRVRGMVSISNGENFSKLNEGFGNGLVVVLKDRKALDHYQNFPAHVAIKERISRMKEKSIAVDFVS